MSSDREQQRANLFDLQVLINVLYVGSNDTFVFVPFRMAGIKQGDIIGRGLVELSKKIPNLLIALNLVTNAVAKFPFFCCSFQGNPKMPHVINEHTVIT